MWTQDSTTILTNWGVAHKYCLCCQMCMFYTVSDRFIACQNHLLPLVHCRIYLDVACFWSMVILILGMHCHHQFHIQWTGMYCCHQLLMLLTDIHYRHQLKYNGLICTVSINNKCSGLVCIVVTDDRCN